MPKIHIAIAAATLIATAVSTSAQSPKFNPPKRYYFALGDSIAFGYQAWRAGAQPLAGFRPHARK